MQGMRKAFTLLEVLMAFGAGSILLGVIYFFHFGLMNTWKITTDKLDLNNVAEITLETLVRDLRMTYRITEFKPDHLILQRLPSEPTPSSDGFSLDRLQLLSIEYILKKEGRRSVLVRRQGLGDEGRRIFDVEDAQKEIFTAYVLDLPRQKGDPFPRFHVFDAFSHPSEELPRISMVRIHLGFKGVADHIDLVSKVFLPICYNNVLQANWSLE
jgi:hypothetical protein